MSPLDLHIHTSHSHDGDVDPAVIVRHAARSGITHLAITDHNRVGGVGPALDASIGRDIEVIPGIEIDCSHNGANIHLLGFYIDHQDERYARFWEDARIRKAELNQKRMDTMQSLGFAIDPELLLATAKDGVVSNVALAESVLSHPFNRDNPALSPYRPGGDKSANPLIGFCWDYTVQGKPAYIDDGNPTLAEALDLVTSTGGVPVLAHPGSSLAGREHLVASILAAGVRGVEAFCGYHNAEAAQYWIGEAERLGAFITCGSDFHGSAKPAITMGGHGGDGYEERVLVALREAAPASAR